MKLTGMFVERIDTLLDKDVGYTEESLSDIFRKVKSHIENSFNNLKYIIKREDISDTSQMEKFTRENKHNLRLLFNKWNKYPLENIDLYRFENQKHPYIVSINKVNEMFKKSKCL